MVTRLVNNEPMKLRLVSYNIHKGFDHLNQNYILEDIRTLIRKTNADIVCLQEVIGENHKLKDEGKIDNQFEFLADQFWPHYSYGKNALYDHGHHGNLILSKFPIENFSNLDLSTNQYERRGILKCRVILPELKQHVTIMTTHLNLTSKGRQKQLKKIDENCYFDDSELCIFTGDFNDWDRKVSSLVEEQWGFKEVFKRLHRSYPKTFPAVYPLLKLDRIYTKNFKAIDAKVLSSPHKLKLSDHLPLYTELEL